MLDDDQRRHLIEHGYVQVPGAVPPEQVDAARRVIHADIGHHGIPPERLPEFRAQSYCPDAKNRPEIADLFNTSPVFGMVESLLGPGRVQKRGGGQIALRFPSLDATQKRIHGHIDGIPTPTNGVEPGTLAHFTLLAGVLLSDLAEPWSGNFTVFPGSHRRFGEWFRDHDPIEMAGGMPSVDPGEPLQVTGRAGDVVLAHYLLVHGIAPNLSPNIRYAVFFRVNHARHTGYRPEAVRDMWLDWDGLHPLLGRAPAAANA